LKVNWVTKKGVIGQVCSCGINYVDAHLVGADGVIYDGSAAADTIGIFCDCVILD